VTAKGRGVARTDQPEAPDETTVREALPELSGDREVLRRRLERLPPGHPSSLATADRGDDRGHRDSPDDSPVSADTGSISLDAGPAEDADRRPLTDAEHTERVRMITEGLDCARDQGLATDKRYLADPTRGIWTRERRDAHDAIIRDLYEESGSVPCERQAIMAGGLGGAGKSTVLDKYAGIDQSRYLTINPDNIKEEMAKRGLIPKLNGVSPMEASDLVHEESSHIAKMLARRAIKDGKNITWDITMSTPASALQRLDALADAGYSTKGVFVDISIDVAVERADARHRDGHDRYREGIGFGGRFVPPEVIKAQKDPEWGSANRRTFEQVKPTFTQWAIYDNSVTGREPQLVQVSAGWNPEEER
jgi:predicted ABC-type ATPase